MSKKTLLNETQIRRFMKLADLGATEKFQSLSEMGGMGVAYDRDEDMGYLAYQVLLLSLMFLYFLLKTKHILMF